MVCVGLMEGGLSAAEFSRVTNTFPHCFCRYSCLGDAAKDCADKANAGECTADMISAQSTAYH